MSGEGVIAPRGEELRSFAQRVGADEKPDISVKMLNALPVKAAERMRSFVRDHACRYREEYGELLQSEEAITGAAREAVHTILRIGKLPENAEELGNRLGEASTAHFDHQLKVGSCPYIYRDMLARGFGEVMSELAADVEKAGAHGQMAR